MPRKMKELLDGWGIRADKRLTIFAIIDRQLAQSLTDMAAIKLLDLQWFLLVGPTLNALGPILDFINLNTAR